MKQPTHLAGKDEAPKAADVAVLRALVVRASKGPWRFDNTESTSGEVFRLFAGKDPEPVAEGLGRADAKAVVALVNAAPGLLAELERLAHELFLIRHADVGNVNAGDVLACYDEGAPAAKATEAKRPEPRGLKAVYDAGWRAAFAHLRHVALREISERDEAKAEAEQLRERVRTLEASLEWERGETLRLREALKGGA